jgi:hypothetical protein
MKLTNQQITTIEQTLVLNGVVYDDDQTGTTRSYCYRN